MLARLAMIAALAALASCAGLEPAGRNASRAPRPTETAAPARAPAPPAATTTAPVTTPGPPAVTAAATPPPTMAPTPAPGRVTLPPAPAPRVTAPASTTPAPSEPARPRSADDDIVVPGQVQTQVPPPAGDPRSVEERRADVRAWDQCVMQVQNAFDADPMRPQLTTPEDYCRESLGMAERMAVPISRQQRRR